jgi:hypothetical protein
MLLLGEFRLENRSHLSNPGRWVHMEQILCEEECLRCFSLVNSVLKTARVCHTTRGSSQATRSKRCNTGSESNGLSRAAARASMGMNRNGPELEGTETVRFPVIV